MISNSDLVKKEREKETGNVLIAGCNKEVEVGKERG